MSNVYATSDFYIAASLCCLGFVVERLDAANPRRVVFCFGGDTAKIEAAVRSYWDGSLKLSPAALFSQQKLLKSRLNSV